VNALLDSYLRHLTIERGLSKNTIGAYRTDLLKYLAFLESRNKDLVTSTSDDVANFTTELSSSGSAASSSARTIASIRGLHKYLILEAKRTDDPTAKTRSPKLPLRLPKALSQAQVIQLLNAAGPEAGAEAESNLIHLRDRALLELLYSTGARVSEIANLDLDEVTDNGLIRVRGKGSKERIVPVGSFAQAALEAYLSRVRPTLVSTSTPAVFLNQRGGRLSRQSIWQIIQKAGEVCGLEVSPHTLRHCFATHLIEGGADVRVVQELLGHASVTTTQIYTKVTIDTLREAFQASHPRARR
jgi:integrase/recombinase XerD